jgi:hypothetical protein
VLALVEQLAHGPALKNHRLLGSVPPRPGQRQDSARVIAAAMTARFVIVKKPNPQEKAYDRFR